MRWRSVPSAILKRSWRAPAAEGTFSRVWSASSIESQADMAGTMAARASASAASTAASAPVPAMAPRAARRRTSCRMPASRLRAPRPFARTSRDRRRERIAREKRKVKKSVAMSGRLCASSKTTLP